MSVCNQLLIRCLTVPSIAVGVLLLGTVTSVPADQLLLEHGGSLHGRPLARAGGARWIETGDGIRVGLAGDRVKAVARLTEPQQQYRLYAPSVADTVSAQWELAEWCRAQRLNDERRVHLQRIIELDPDYGPARSALGYIQVGARWMTQAQRMEERGYRYYQGRWRLEQEIKLLEEEEESDEAHRSWLMNLKRWRSEVVSKRSAEAAHQIRSIRDPEAVKPLAKYVSREPLVPLQDLYIEALAGIDSRAAGRTLVEVTLNVRDEELFYKCLDRLAARPRAGVAEDLMKALRSDKNTRVNRAAMALAKMQHGPAVGPLIDALVTSHVIVWPPPKPGGTAMTSTFGRVNDGSGSETPLGGADIQAGQSSQAMLIPVRNSEVLTALVDLTGGVNFGYDQGSWRSWFLIRNRQLAPDTVLRQ